MTTSQTQTGEHQSAHSISGYRKRVSTFGQIWSLARRDISIAISLLVIAVIIVLALLPGIVSPYDPIDIDPANRLQGPSTDHFFGTDHLGRDVFSRVVYATRTTVGVSALVVIFAALIGVTIGAISGYSSRYVDEVLMRTVDLFLAFPLLVLAMTIVTALGPGLLNAMFALVVVWWAQYARLTRGLVLQMRDREFVTAAHSIGVTSTRMLYRHILPNCFSPLLVKGTLDVAVAVLVTASLSFLGLGVQPPDPDWGAMISSAREFIRDAWWYPTFPGLAIFVTVMALNLIGDALRDILDPRLRQ